MGQSRFRLGGAWVKTDGESLLMYEQVFSLTNLSFPAKGLIQKALSIMQLKIILK